MADTLADLETKSRLHYYLLAAVLLLPLMVVVAAWAVPSDIERMYRVTWTFGAVILGFLSLMIWMFLFARQVWWVAVVAFVVLGGFAWATARVRFDGDMVPYSVDFSWWPGPEEVKGEAVAHHEVEDNDFPGFRGKYRDGVVHGPRLARDWKENPPTLIWRAPLGAGHGAFAIVGNNAVTLEQVDTNEAVVCYDIANRSVRWRDEYPAFFNEPQGGPGPRGTPTIADGKVYSYGATGILRCVDLETGKLDWSVNSLEGNKPIQWGMSGSPLVVDNLVVVNPGVQLGGPGAMIAYDRKTGKQVWASGKEQAGYSSPQLATLAGVKQVLIFDAAGLSSYDLEKGTKLWQHPWVTNYGINVAQPVVLEGERVFISSGYGVGCAMLKISHADDQWTVKEEWKERTLRCKFTSPVFRAGYLYGLDDGRLVCIDPKDGKRAWRGDRYGHGQILLADDLILIQEEFGDIALVEANPEAFKQLARFTVFPRTRTWNTPALAGGIAFLRNDRELAWFDLRAR
ncbi:MAG: PQQ-binding-like beta-propeller repeat protein [Gemmataceae bacterium]